MRYFKRFTAYFSKGEIALWSGSALSIIISFFLFEPSNYFILAGSLIGITSLILTAKGNPAGQFLMIIFSMIYAYLSFSLSYYGEMVTYLGMTAPMAVFAFVSWMKSPYGGKKSEVTVACLSRTDWIIAGVLTILVTVGFYFILDHFHTTCIWLSTVSISTSFIAVYLTYKRSPYYAIGYAANDMILIALWLVAAAQNASYTSVVVCFLAFLVNDIYGYRSWIKLKERQSQSGALDE